MSAKFKYQRFKPLFILKGGKRIQAERALAKARTHGIHLVVGSKVREYIKSKGCLTSGELIPQLSSKLCCILDCAVERAKAKGKNKVEAKDISMRL